MLCLCAAIAASYPSKVESMYQRRHEGHWEICCIYHMIHVIVLVWGFCDRGFNGVERGMVYRYPGMVMNELMTAVAYRYRWFFMLI